jgi:hypothetical protein
MLLSLVPAFIAFFYIRAYGVNVPVVDDFVFINGFTDYFSGKLAPEYFLGLHNGHSLFFGKILMLILGLITHFNIVAEMYLSWAFLLTTQFLLTHMLSKTLGATLKTAALCLPVSLLLFGLRPWDVFLNGSVFLNSMTIFFVISSITAMFHVRPETVSSPFLIALLCAILAGFSGSASGQLVWIVGLLQLAIPLRHRALEYRTMRIWLACLIASCGTYGLLSLSTPRTPVPVPHAAILDRLTGIPPYLFTLFGFPFCTTPDATQLCGAIIIAIYIGLAAFLVIKRPPLERHNHALLAALAVFLYGGIAMALVTVARSERGYLEAMASRYAQFSNITLLGVYLVLCFSEIKPVAARYFIFVTVLLLVGTTSYAGYSTAIFNGAYWRNLQLKNAYLLRTNEIQVDDDLKALQSNPYFVRVQAAALKRYNLSVFSRPAAPDEIDKLPSSNREATYCLDQQQPSTQETTGPNKVTVRRSEGKSISVSGWTFDGESGAPAKRVALLVDKNKIIPACYGLRYPGVAENFKNKRLADCGFYASFSPSILAPGEHDVSLAVESTGGQMIYPTKTILKVNVN